MPKNPGCRRVEPATCAGLTSRLQIAASMLLAEHAWIDGGRCMNWREYSTPRGLRIALLQGIGAGAAAVVVRPGQPLLNHPLPQVFVIPVSYTHLRAHETDSYLVCRLL